MTSIAEQVLTNRGLNQEVTSKRKVDGANQYDRFEGIARRGESRIPITFTEEYRQRVLDTPEDLAVYPAAVHTQIIQDLLGVHLQGDQLAYAICYGIAVSSALQILAREKTVDNEREQLMEGVNAKSTEEIRVTLQGIDPVHIIDSLLTWGRIDEAREQRMVSGMLKSQYSRIAQEDQELGRWHQRAFLAIGFIHAFEEKRDFTRVRSRIERSLRRRDQLAHTK